MTPSLSSLRLPAAVLGSARWLAGRAAAVIALAVLVSTLVFLRAGVMPKLGRLPSFDWDRYWPALRQYLEHLAGFTFGPLYYQPLGGGLAPDARTLTPIEVIIGRTLPVTLILFFAALLIGVILGLLLGLMASRFGWKGTQGLTLGAAVVGLSLPDVLLIVGAQFGILALREKIGFLLVPVMGDLMNPISFRELILPVLLLALFPVAYTSRLALAAFDDVAAEEYIRTARAIGSSPRRTLWRHAFKNALIATLPGVPALTGVLISNLILIEFLGQYQGIGRLLTQELTAAYPSPNLLASVSICFAFMFLAIDSAIDLLLLWLDPRAVSARQERQVARANERLTLTRTGEAAPFSIRVAAAFQLLLAPFLMLVSLAAAAWHGIRSATGAGMKAAAISVLRQYRRNWPLALGTLIVLSLTLVGLLGPAVIDKDPNKITPIIIQGKDWLFPPYPPSPEFPLGTDELGRDTLTRLIHGAWYSLLFAAIIVPVRMLPGVLLGMAAGWTDGWWARLVQRTAAFFGAVPTLLIPVVLIPAIFVPPVPPSAGNPNPPPPAPAWLVLSVNVLILGMIGWPRIAESVRLMTRELSERPFVESARAVGGPSRHLLARHIFPHLSTRLAVMAAAEMSWVMMLMAQLGLFGIFLGGTFPLEVVGQVPQLPDWAHMMANPARYLFKNQWQMLAPATAFFIAILGFNLLAEGLRRAALQPQQHVYKG